MTEILNPNSRGPGAGQFERNLRHRIAGQNEAIEQIVKIYQLYLAGLCPAGRPIANLLFLGPTGSGKTRVAEATAECLAGHPGALIKIDCAEYQHGHEIAKLIGAPPGYLGHRETAPLLSQESLKRCHTDTMKLSFVLFDEIEKASDGLWNLLLGILDKATLTLGDNPKVDFSQTFIFLTGNLGAGEMAALAEPRFGFAPPAASPDRISRSGSEAARRRFTPEFINRLDRIVVFQPLSQSDLERILDLELDVVQKRVLAAPDGRQFVFILTKSARQFLLAEGTDSRYGARHLKRALGRLLVVPLANLVANGEIRQGDQILVDREPGAADLTFALEVEAPPSPEAAQPIAKITWRGIWDKLRSGS